MQIPIKYTPTYGWLNAGSMYHIANHSFGRTWLEYEDQTEILCTHRTSGYKQYFTDDLVATFNVCDDCNQVIHEWEY